MYLKNLKLLNFRNFTSQDFDFHPEFNFIYGKNAQGKTNIIEAIYYLSQLKSFRSSNREELVKKGSEFGSLQAVFEKNDLTFDISIHLTEHDRNILLNNKKPPQIKDYYELIPLILFEPRHIYLFRDSPSERRHYLNRALFLQDAGFLNLLKNYEKVVTQKNKILKETQDPTMLEIWNEQQADWGSKIMHQRLCWFEKLNTFLHTEYRALSHSKENLQLFYLPSKNLFSANTTAASLSQIEIKNLLLEKMANLKRDELQRRESLVGPHRDDYFAALGERHMGQFGSQGENRSVLIALKLSELKMFREKFSKTPLFLLDDVASELDTERCSYLFSYLKNESTQVFLTTTDAHMTGLNYQGHFSAFIIENGFGQAIKQP